MHKKLNWFFNIEILLQIPGWLFAFIMFLVQLLEGDGIHLPFLFSMTCVILSVFPIVFIFTIKKIVVNYTKNNKIAYLRIVLLLLLAINGIIFCFFGGSIFFYGFNYSVMPISLHKYYPIFLASYTLLISCFYFKLLQNEFRFLQNPTFDKIDIIDHLNNY